MKCSSEFLYIDIMPVFLGLWKSHIQERKQNKKKTKKKPPR